MQVARVGPALATVVVVTGAVVVVGATDVDDVVAGEALSVRLTCTAESWLVTVSLPRKNAAAMSAITARLTAICRRVTVTCFDSGTAQVSH